jgi:hypothetical protein
MGTNLDFIRKGKQVSSFRSPHLRNKFAKCPGSLKKCLLEKIKKWVLSIEIHEYFVKLKP